MRKNCTIIGSDKGGVGKSLFAQIVISAFDQAKRPLQIVEIDHQRKLSSIYGQRVALSLSAGPSIEASLADRLASASFFNQAHEVWCAADTLTDLGANVTTPLFAWADYVDLAANAEEDELDFHFISVCSPDDQSLRSAVASLSSARRALGRDAQLFLVLNEISPGVGYRPYEQTDTFRQILAMHQTHGVEIIHIPFCGSAIMEWSKAFGMTVLQLLDPNSGALDKISGIAGFSRMDRRMHVKDFTNWLQRVQQAMTPIFERSVYQPGILQAAE